MEFVDGLLLAWSKKLKKNDEHQAVYEEETRVA